jgi:hypothetical protein
MQIKDLGETSEQNIERLQWIQSLPQNEINIDRRNRQLASGEITRKEFNERIAAQCGFPSIPQTDIISRLQIEDRKDKECKKVPWCNRKATKTERCDIHAEVHAAYKDNRTDEQKAIGAYYDRVMNRSDNGSMDYLSDEREDQ